MDMPITADREPDFMALEHYLTAFEMILMLQLGTGAQGGFGLMEPLWPLIGQDLPIEAAPSLELGTLQDMASAQKLVKLGLVRLELMPGCERPTDMVLTGRGEELFRYWTGALEEMGFQAPMPEPR